MYILISLHLCWKTDPFSLLLDPLSKHNLMVWGFISVFCSSPLVCYGVFTSLISCFWLLELYSTFWSQVVWFIHLQYCFGCWDSLKLREKVCMNVCMHAPQLHVEVRGQLPGMGCSSPWVLWLELRSSGLYCTYLYLKKHPAGLLHFSIRYCFGSLGFLEVLYDLSVAVSGFSTEIVLHLPFEEVVSFNNVNSSGLPAELSFHLEFFVEFISKYINSLWCCYKLFYFLNFHLGSLFMNKCNW